MTEGMDCVVNLIEFDTHEGSVGEGGRKGGREGGGSSSFAEGFSVKATEGGGDMRQILMCDFCISHSPFLPPSLPPSLPPGAVFLPSSKEKIRAFRSILKKHGRLSTLRRSKGAEEMGACGQLGDLAMARKIRAMEEEGGRGGEGGREERKQGSSVGDV